MYSPLKTKIVSVTKIDNLAERAKTNNFGYYEVKKLNPRILGNTLPDGQWDIKVMK